MKTFKEFEKQIDEDHQRDVNLANLIKDEAKKLIQAVQRGKWRVVKKTYSNIGKLIK